LFFFFCEITLFKIVVDFFFNQITKLDVCVNSPPPNA
jgi:hypothetical protein